MHPNPVDRAKEYDSLRKELEIFITAAETLQRNCVVAVALTYSWLIHEYKPPEKAPIIGYLIPVVIAILGAIKSWAMEEHAKIIGSYLKSIEDNLKRPGWETHFAEKKYGHQRHALKWFWVVFVAATIFGSYSIMPFQFCRL